MPPLTFDAAVNIVQAEFDQHQSDVVVSCQIRDCQNISDHCQAFPTLYSPGANRIVSQLSTFARVGCGLSPPGVQNPSKLL